MVLDTTVPAYAIDQRQVWKVMTYHDTLHIGISVLSIVAWLFIITKLYFTLTAPVEGAEVGSFGSSYSFLPFFALIATYPIIYYVNQVVLTQKGTRSGLLANLDPYFAICTDGPDGLTDKEMNLGAVGKVNYKCVKEEDNFNFEYSQMIIGRAYYMIYSIFALTLFLFTQSAGKFKNTLVTSDSPFVTRLIQLALFLALILMASNVFVQYYYLSTFAMYFFMNILQMLGAIMTMIVSFILFRLAYLYV
jgi:hypothetical protein